MPTFTLNFSRPGAQVLLQYYLFRCSLKDLDPQVLTIAPTDWRPIAKWLQQLAESRASRGFALCWLADNGMLDVRALYRPGAPDSFAQVRFQRLVMTAPAGMLETLALVGDDDRQARLATELDWPAPGSPRRSRGTGA